MASPWRVGPTKLKWNPESRWSVHPTHPPLSVDVILFSCYSFSSPTSLSVSFYSGRLTASANCAVAPNSLWPITHWKHTKKENIQASEGVRNGKTLSLLPPSTTNHPPYMHTWANSRNVDGTEQVQPVCQCPLWWVECTNSTNRGGRVEVWIGKVCQRRNGFEDRWIW